MNRTGWIVLALAMTVSPALAQDRARVASDVRRPTSEVPSSTSEAHPTLDLGHRTSAGRNSQLRGRAPAPKPRLPRRPLIPRGYVTVNAGYQGTSNGFTNAWSYPSNFETASVTARYPVNSGVLLDVGGGIRVRGDFTVGVALSRYRRSDIATLSTSIPNPLLFDQPRAYDGTTGTPARTETAVHVQAMYTFPVASKVQMGVFGGPTFFTIDQVFVTAVNFAEVYPYDSLIFSGLSTQRQSASKVGVNFGADVTYLLVKKVGVGALIRYSRATVSLPAAGNTSVDATAGGLQVGGGVRVRF